MRNFREFIDNIDNNDDVDEALTMAQRLKMKATMKKNKGKIKLGRKRAAKKLASPEKLKGKSMKKARDILTKKLLKGKSKNDLSFAGRQSLEKKLDKKKAVIKKIAKKMLPAVKKADKAKLQKNKKKKDESVQHEAIATEAKSKYYVTTPTEKEIKKAMKKIPIWSKKLGEEDVNYEKEKQK